MIVYHIMLLPSAPSWAASESSDERWRGRHCESEVGVMRPPDSCDSPCEEREREREREKERNYC